MSLQSDGSELAISYRNAKDIPGLGTYVSSEKNLKPGVFEFYHHFCTKCGVHVSITGNAAFMVCDFSHKTMF